MTSAFKETASAGLLRSAMAGAASSLGEDFDLAELAEALPALAFVADGDGANLRTNLRFQRYTGLSAEALLGDGWLDALHPDDRPGARETWRAAILAQEPYEGQYRFVSAEGEARWFLCRGAPVRSGSQILRWVGICTDIDDQKRSEDAHRNSGDGPLVERMAASFLRMIRDNPFGVYVVDADFRFVEASRGALKAFAKVGPLLGRDFGEVMRMIWPEAVATDTIARFRHTLATGEPHVAKDFVETRADAGDTQAYDWRIERILLPDGRFGIVCYFYDLTEQKAQARRQAFRLELEQALRDLHDPQAMMAAATEMLGRHLGAAQVGFAEAEADQAHIVVRRDWNDGRVLSVVGRWRMDDFGPAFIREMKAGRTVAIADVRTDARTAEPAVLEAYAGIGVRAILDLALIRDGLMVAMMFIHHHEPRDWSEVEIALAEETCGRLWAAVESARGERVIRQLLERSEIAQDAARAAFFEYQPASGQFFRSPAIEAILGWQPAAIDQPSMSWRSLVHPDDLPIFDGQNGDALRGRASFASEYRVRHRDGHYVWIADAGRVIRAEDASIDRVVGMVMDISARKAGEIALAESEARFRRLAETIPAHVFVADAENGNLYTNPQFQTFAGLTADQLLGKGWLRIVHPDEAAEMSARWAECRRNGESYQAETRVRAADGSYRWFLFRGDPIRDTEGRVVQWIGAGIDIQELVEARRALELGNAGLEARVSERTEDLRRANGRLRAEIGQREAAQAALAQSQKLEALGQLTSGIAHDFNNVIAAISGGFSVIERRTDDPRIAEITRHGVKAAERGAAIVRQLLAFARQETLEPRTVDLAELLRNSAPLLRRAAGPALTFDLDCPTPMWQVRVDAAQLETALINLAVNARDAMPDGGRLTLTAAISPQDAPDHPPELARRDAVRLTMADTGPGMAPDVLQRVVEPFFTTKGPGKGTGLGLAMVHGFANQSGGALRIESRLGVGTSISIYLPRSEEPMEGASETAGEPEAALHGRAAILLVDDDDAVRGVTAAQLRDLGYRVIEADGHDAALQRTADSDGVDALVTDVVMPEKDGIELAAALRRARPGLPVLFLTGHADRSRLAGEAVLSKPFAPAALSRAVLAMLGRLPEAGGAEQEALLDRLHGRLRSRCLKAMLKDWRRAARQGSLPLLADFDPEACEEPHKIVIAEADSGHVPIRFRFLSVGSELEKLLGHPLTDEAIAVTGDDWPTSWEAAYRRCVRSRRPCYDYLRLDLGDGPVEILERLLLPYSTDGRLVDRLVGCVVVQASEPAPRRLEVAGLGASGDA